MKERDRKSERERGRRREEEGEREKGFSTCQKGSGSISLDVCIVGD
jgi:hypothetical protein